MDITSEEKDKIIQICRTWLKNPEEGMKLPNGGYAYGLCSSITNRIYPHLPNRWDYVHRRLSVWFLVWAHENGYEVNSGYLERHYLGGPVSPTRIKAMQDLLAYLEKTE